MITVLRFIKTKIITTNLHYNDIYKINNKYVFQIKEILCDLSPKLFILKDHRSYNNCTK